MEQEQFIFDYIEGALTPEGEAELFRVLSINEDLRAELKSQLAIKNAVRGDVVAFTPKAQSTMNIFNSVGLTPPPGIAPVTSPGFFTSLGAKLSSLSPLILSGTIASVATAVIIFMFYNFGAFDDILRLRYGMSETAQTTVNNEIPVMTSEALEHQNTQSGNNLASGNITQPETKVVYKYIYYTDNVKSQVEIESLDKLPNLSPNNSIPVNNDLLMNKHTTQNFLRLDNMKPQNLKKILLLDRSTMPLLAVDNDFKPIENFAIELRGAIYDYGKDVRIDPSKSDLSNIGLTLTYALTDEFKVGIDYHRENFYQTFSGLEEGGMYNYHQNPSIETYGIMIRYNPDILRFSFVSPYVQFNGGISEIGPVVRGIAGVELSSSDNYKFILVMGSITYDLHTMANGSAPAKMVFKLVSD